MHDWRWLCRAWRRVFAIPANPEIHHNTAQINQVVNAPGTLPMLLIDMLAEEQIAAAINRGEFDDLPGKGKPMVLEDDVAVPDELRVAYRILKNAGCLPPEQELRREIRQVEGLLGQVATDLEAQRIRRRLCLMRTRLAMQGRDVNLLVHEAAYREKLMRRVARSDDEKNRS